MIMAADRMRMVVMMRGRGKKNIGGEGGGRGGRGGAISESERYIA